MKGVIYARYSSDNQREESIEGQLRECKAYAEKNGIEIIGTYIDRALSAKTDNRPEFQKMIKDSNKCIFDIVLVWKLDRFARNRYDSAFYKATLKKNNVKLMSATENISDGADGILLEAILEGFAEYYSVELAEKIKRGMTENALKLRSNGVRAPIGYYIDSEKHFQIDEDKAPIIADIFTMYNNGKKISEIVEIMKNRGVTNQGNFMNYNAIFRILTNRKYIGEYKFGNIVVPNAFDGIIDEGLFNNVQNRMKRNKKAPAMHRSEDDYLLTTHLFCGKCGAMMTGEIGTSHTSVKYRYYKCNHAKKKKCDKKTVRKEWIENLVLDVILQLITNDEMIKELAERVYQIQNVESAESIMLKAQLEDVERKLNNLIEAISQGIFSATTKKALDDLEDQKKHIENEIIQNEIRNPILSKDQILFALNNYRKLDLSNQSDKQKLIDSFVNSIYLYDDHFIITFNYKNSSKKVTFKEINSSSLTSFTPPIKDTATKVAVSFIIIIGRIELEKVCALAYIFVLFKSLIICENYGRIILQTYLRRIIMVKHIILWKLKDEFNTDSVKQDIKTGLEGLMGKIPGLTQIKVQTECLSSSNVDVMLYSVFENQDALSGYAVHPEHILVADTKVRPFTESRSCIDFEVE